MAETARTRTARMPRLHRPRRWRMAHEVGRHVSGASTATGSGCVRIIVGMWSPSAIVVRTWFADGGYASDDRSHSDLERAGRILRWQSRVTGRRPRRARTGPDRRTITPTRNHRTVPKTHPVDERPAVLMRT